jgi:hypothetical protein
MVRLGLALILLSATGSTIAALPPAGDPVRSFADKMAQAMKENDEPTLRDNLAPAMIATYGATTLIAPLSKIKARYGEIIGFEAKDASVGGMKVGTRTLRTATLWYSLKTTKSESGAFLKISVTKEGDRFFLAGYNVTEFLGGKIPPNLQGALAPAVQQRAAGDVRNART